MKVLLLIEEIIIGKLMKSIIQNEYTNAEVNWKDNAADFKSVLEQEQYDIIILHDMISGRASLEIAELIRTEMNIFVPVIMVTDIKMEQFQKKAYQAGITSFIYQPFGMGDVVAAINSVVVA